MRLTKAHVTTPLVSVWLIISLLGCSFAWQPVRNPTADEKLMIPIVARILDEQLAVVEPVLSEEGELDNRIRSVLESYDGQAIVQEMLLEEGGVDLLRFSHALATGASSEELLSEAQHLLGAKEYKELTENVRSVERQLRTLGEEHLRALPPSQKAPFLRDLQKLITKTLVLMVAGIVYACIPNMVFWGKITAAAAIAVAAGITATTIMSIYRYYQQDDASLSQSFEQWITDVTTDPAAAYAVATSMTTIGKTMTNGAVVTGLILVVFAIYQVVDLVKPMLKKYNFDA
ncbi:MAG: hypothetical protein ACOX0W_05670 [Sphaerochaetaceae bacterium]|jgi:hypothetical protein